MYSFYPYLVPLAPLIAALLTTLPRRHLKQSNYQIAWLITFAGFIGSLLLLWQLIQNPEPINLFFFETHWEFLPVVELSIDRLAAVMMAVISGFGTLLYHYSIRYLQQDHNQGRYQTLLALKLGIQLCMVASADLITLFICWQLLSWLLCLLAHNFSHVPTANGSFRTFIMLRAGDLFFMGGIALAYHLYGTVRFSELFNIASLNQTSFSIFGSGFEITAATLITMLIFFAAMIKSAQFPMHMWLPDSLYAPTPIHALLHAGGINAGGFLLTRLAPLFILSSSTLHFALVIGLLTAILGTSMMLVQNDIKKTLGYSTIGQMGYMIMECGLGAFSLAVFHLLAHGLFKANVFLNCGKGIHEAREQPVKAPLPKQGESESKTNGLSVFAFSLLVPLLITVGAHYLLGVSFLEHQGLFILLLFSWITVSQAMLTLFRLNKSSLSKATMMLVLSAVAIAYFFAAEKFTHFLIPDPNLIEAYYHAAEMPYSLFLMLTTVLILSILAVWFFTVRRQQGDKRSASGLLKTNSYLFFMNRLYLDAIALRLLNTFKRIGRKIDQSPLLLVLILVTSLAFVFMQAVGLSALPFNTILLLLASAFLLPIFPFHTLYLAALTRAPRRLARLLCALLPALGLYLMIFLLPEIPTGVLPAISLLAIISALWGSIKALMQTRASHLLSYGGLALYSILWWHFAQTGQMDSEALFYGSALTLTWAALYLAWDRVRARYGDLELKDISGLYQTMPRFASCMSLMIMVAVGLPPFGLFFGLAGILLSPSTAISSGTLIIILTWFLACWYLFKFMQGLLFGGARRDLYYEDLRPTEIMVFVVVILLLVLSSGVSQDHLMEVIR